MASEATRTTPEYKARVAARRRERYAADPAFREKVKATSRAYHKAHRRECLRAIRKTHWESRYGLSPQEYFEMLERQSGGCAVCGSRDVSKGRKHLPVDHDHVTGRVRGILCNHCNVALGMLQEDPQRILKLLDYLEQSRNEETTHGTA